MAIRLNFTGTPALQPQWLRGFIALAVIVIFILLVGQ